MEQPAGDKTEPIAVIGLGCRFPGDATSPEALWDMLLRGDSAWSEFPEDRLNISTYYHPSGTRQGTICFRGAHFLKQNVAAFDGSFFGIPADEAKAVDPQQRMLLEVTVEALDNAGIDRNAIRKSETGVWIGSFVKDYEQIVLRDCDDQPQYGATGNGTAIMSNRLSYFLDLSGPSMTIDTGCSASLVCVHQACQSLRTRETDMALAGGSGLILTPNTMMPMTALNFLSPDGKSYTFDARANGYGRGEGLGIVILKRLSDAIRDNDNIRAVIRNTRLNQDGRTPGELAEDINDWSKTLISQGITLPSTEAQISNMRSVYERAGLDPARTAFVECHGTGTQAGDVRELTALSQSICKDRPIDKPVYVGSIKTNIGHLEGAAGIAGIIKGILAVERGIIPKHINFMAPGNPAIDFEAWKIKVPTENTPWPVSGLRRASVNSFGFGGTNAHAILDDAAHYLAERGLCANHSTSISDEIRDPSISYRDLAATIAAVKNRRRELAAQTQGRDLPLQNPKLHVFVFSAHDQTSLLHILRDYAQYLSDRKRDTPSSVGFLEDLAYTLGCRRTKLQWRVSITAQSVDELATKLRDVGETDMIRTFEDKKPNVAFVFGGQGAQWYAMGRELLRDDIFLESIATASAYMTDKLGSEFSLLTELLNDKQSSRINNPDISQAATIALQIALVDLLVHRCGVVPSSVVGHSSGEIAAAYASGMISRETAWELAYYRGICVTSLLQFPMRENATHGKMLAVGLSETDAAKYVARVGKDRVTIACINSSASVTLSGDGDAILEVQRSLNSDGIFNRLLVVDVAYHSHHMIRCASGYRNSIAHLLSREPVRSVLKHPHSAGRLLKDSDLPLADTNTNLIPHTERTKMFSSVAGIQVEWQSLTDMYWMANLVSPVRFSDAVTALLHHSNGQRPDIVIEMGPHATLQSSLQQIFKDDTTLRQQPKYISMLRRNVDAGITALEAVGELWSRGCSIDMPWVIMRNVQFRRLRLVTDLPNYPWSHDTCHWYESHLSRANRLMPHGRYDLIGRPTVDSIPFQPRWRGFFRIKENPWLEQHQVQKTTIYPAAGMLSMVLEGASQVAPDFKIGIEISRFRIEKAMLIPSTDRGLEYALNFNKIDEVRKHIPGEFNYSPPFATTSLSYEFSIYSKLLNKAWQQHGSGLVTIHSGEETVEDSADDQANSENALRTRRYHEKYLMTKITCDDPVIPRQLYETLDVVGMNYGPLFQNITSLYKRDNDCTFVIRIPDTKSVMPAQFEYPHILHPATLDSVFQTAFSFGSDSMVPSYIGSVYISMDPKLPSGAGKEFVGYATAERRDLRESNVMFALSDASWNSSNLEAVQVPLIVIKDMKFTALSTTRDFNAAKFIPNHHNLCSEIMWEQSSDVALDDFNGQEIERMPGAIFLLVPESMDISLTQLCTKLCRKLNCATLTLAQIKEGHCKSHFCLSLLEVAPEDHFIWNWSAADYAAFKSLLNAIRGMLWLTRGAQIEPDNPKSGLFQALARTIRSESPQANLVALDIGIKTDLATTFLVDKIAALLLSVFLNNSPPESRETDYAERDGQLLVPRLVPMASLNDMIERSNVLAEPRLEQRAQQAGRQLESKTGEVGNSNTAYWDGNCARELLAADTVAIKVLAAGLSVLDANIMMGDVYDHSLGTDAYGIIEAIGDDVDGLTIGDRIVAVARGSLRQQIRCHRSLVQKVPEDTDPAIVLLPTPIALAVYALQSLASLKQGNSILVHAGAGSFGQAAVRLARHIGATVFVTCTDDDQRDILMHDHQLSEEMILDGNNNSFIESIMSLTHNVGVNVVFDPTSDYRESNCQCVADLGHIISLTKKITVKGQIVDPPGKTFSVSIVDFALLVEDEPWRLAEASEFLSSIDMRLWLPQHCSVRKMDDWSDLSKVLNALTKDSQFGMAYYVPSETTTVAVMPQRQHRAREHLSPEGTYVLAGQGGLGMHIARMLEANGVTNIALLSRSGSVCDASQATIAFLQRRGVNVKVLKVDICDGFALEAAVDEIQTSMPPIRGLFQCAAALHDAVFDTMTYENWQVAIRPKTIGSWNLHKIFPKDMDFFIFLSSSAGIIGNRGQANYAAGNAFQDALARHINAKGIIRSVSIDLGPILGAGMLTEDPLTLDKLKTAGFFGIRLQDFERVIERAITGYTEGDERIPPQVVMGVGTGGIVRQNKPADPHWTRTALFTHLNKVDMPTEADGLDSALDVSEETMKTLLTNTDTDEEASHIVTHGLCSVLAISMGKQADDLDGGRPPCAYGVDSLVAVNIRNWVHNECGVDVSIFEVLSDASISDLGAIIVERGGFGKAK